MFCSGHSLGGTKGYQVSEILGQFLRILMSANQKVVILPLDVTDAAKLSAFLQAQSASHTRYFHPFAFDEASVRKLLAEARQDVYQGFYRDEDLIGMMMLRGWDEGYEVPAVGVIVGEQYFIRNFMQMCLDAAKEICRARGCSRIIYKSHPANVPATRAARFGFVQTGVDVHSGYFIYHLEF